MTEFREAKAASDLLPGLSQCILRAGVNRFKQLPPIFAAECMATFAVAKSLGVQLNHVSMQGRLTFIARS